MLLAFAVWVGSGFASKLYLAYRLNAEVKQLQRDNQGISDANRGYAEQLRGLSDPAGEEEVLRQHNYSQPGETVYVIVRPSPSPSPSPHR
ncbi:MAG TPA: septum formation initiator family protein [Candidatus Dormibacteraeota bacterium]|jgi:cell division protein FtsB|nr:septum formation initiator family protein [Candidatus Dormibacteraeota bacterium]